MIPGNRTKTNPLIAIIGVVLFLIVLFYLIKGVFWILGLIWLPLIILTFFIDKKVLLDYGKWIMNLFKTKWYYGLGAAGMTFFGLPFVSAFLFGKAMFKKKVIGGDMGKMFKEEEDSGFTDYEIVDSEIVIDDVELEQEELDLPEIDDNLNTLDNDSPYENLFENDK